MVKINKNILKITPYQPGKPIEEVKRELGLKEVIKLASNENAFGPSPKAISAIRRAVININRYPEGSCYYLRSALSSYLKISSQNLIFGNGSDEIIDIIVKAFSGSDGEILTADVTFLEYKIISEQNSRRVKTAPLKNFKYDLSGIKKLITPKTRIIFIANPNNPTGTYLTKSELNGFIKGIPKDIIIVLDEAYFEFTDFHDFPISIDYISKAANVIILRTFSKAYGLAGLRIGYAIAKEKLIPYLERVRQPFNVNYLAQIGAQAALKDVAFLKKSVKAIKEGKIYLYREFNKLGLEFIPTAANFILINFKQDTTLIFRKLLELGVIVRELKQYSLNNFIRLTIGTEKENRKFIKALKKVLAFTIQS